METLSPSSGETWRGNRLAPESSRREFILGVGGAALSVAWPRATLAQLNPMPVVGFLRSSGAGDNAHLENALRRGLAEGGFIEGQNVAVEYRYADNRHERLPQLAAELIRLRASVVIGNSVAIRAMMNASSPMPLVFVVGTDPQRVGLVASINRPGGNVTGVVFGTTNLASKRVSLLVELVPQVVAFGVLIDRMLPDSQTELKDAEDAGRAVGRRILPAHVATEDEIKTALARLVREGVGGLLVGSGPSFLGRRDQIIGLAASHRLPACYVDEVYPEAGGLMSYGPSQTDAYRRGGAYVARILKGEKPAEMPVDMAIKYDLVINLKTSKALALAVPPTILALADRVVE